MWCASATAQGIMLCGVPLQQRKASCYVVCLCISARHHVMWCASASAQGIMLCGVPLYQRKASCYSDDREYKHTKLQKHRLRGCRFHDNEEVERALRKWLQMQDSDFYGFFVQFRAKMRQMNRCLGDYAEKH
jgi:hypothetical protein